MSVSLFRLFTKDLILVDQTPGEALIAFDSVKKSPDPELEIIDITTRTTCQEKRYN